MPTRSSFFPPIIGSVAAPQLAAAAPASNRVALYANVGPKLTHYDVDVDRAELTPRETVTLPAKVQYAWPHASRRYLYVATSSSASGHGPAGTEHHVTAFRIDPASGALTQHGEPIRLPTRPVHLTTDIPSRFILVAFNYPSSLHVYRINDDFTPGEEVAQPGPIDPGIFAHQVRVTPDNKLAVLVTRGNEGTATKAEDPGALKVFDYREGVLTNEVSIAPDGGRNFGPRHLDFHPTKPWMYVSIETQNKMYMYRMQDGRIDPDIAYRKETLAEPGNIRARQAAGTVHVHPNGRFLYAANRAQATIDQNTGEPTPIQHIETRKIHPRTFHIDPSGRLMVVQHNLPVNVREGGSIRRVPAGLTVFRIGDDGKLTFASAYDIEVGDSLMFWMGMV